MMLYKNVLFCYGFFATISQCVNNRDSLLIRYISISVWKFLLYLRENPTQIGLRKKESYWLTQIECIRLRLCKFCLFFFFTSKLKHFHNLIFLFLLDLHHSQALCEAKMEMPAALDLIFFLIQVPGNKCPVTWQNFQQRSYFCHWITWQSCEPISGARECHVQIGLGHMIHSWAGLGA